MKVKEIKEWSVSAVRNMCINNHYYTSGSCEEYDQMLHFVYTHKPTNNNLLKVAENIVNHSDLTRYNQTYKENVESIMFNLYADCVNVFFEIQ